jgi:hypothetical protein
MDNIEFIVRKASETFVRVTKMFMSNERLVDLGSKYPFVKTRIYFIKNLYRIIYKKMTTNNP